MSTDSLHVVTGGPGSGKSTLIDALAAAGIATSPEVGRAIIKEEMASGGTALPWIDHLAFAERMLEREIAAYEAALVSGQTVVLDRGVPDVVGFLRVSGLAVPAAIDRAARACRYNPRVFIAPWWEDIFTADAERKQTPEEARATFAVMVETYRDYGYTLVELPRAPVADRVAFVRRALAQPSPPPLVGRSKETIMDGQPNKPGGSVTPGGEVRKPEDQQAVKNQGEVSPDDYPARDDARPDPDAPQR